MNTKVSSKGQVVIPKSVRNHYQWKPGTVLKIEETEEGVLLTPVSHGSLAQDQVFGCLKDEVHHRVSIEEMDEAILREAKKERPQP